MTREQIVMLTMWILGALAGFGFHDVIANLAAR